MDPPPPPATLGFADLGQAFLTTVFTGGVEAEDQKTEGLNDIHIYLLCATICFVLQWSGNYFAIYPLARWALPETANKRKMVRKAGVSGTDLWMYSFFTIAGLRVCYAQPWIWPSSLWWIDKLSGSHSLITPSFKFMYLLYGGRYLSHLVSVLIEPKKKDFWQMALHHLTTTVLVLVSYCSDYTRVGGAVMFLLDPADPPLHTAKLCLYMAGGKGGESRWQFAADRFFEIFAVLFFVTRCCLYPYIVWSAAFESVRHLGRSRNPSTFEINGSNYVTEELVAIGLLAILMLLQFFWLFLIIKVAIKPHAEDNRSDSDDDDPSVHQPAARKKQQ